MYSKKIFIALVLLISIFQLAISQNNTNSPYTRFGYGDVTESTPTELRGMGGVSITNYSKNTINPVNPASYSSVDSLTFMFDVATSFRYSRFSDKNDASSNTLNGNLEYITVRLPLFRNWGFSAGLLPYSFSGYAFSQSDSLTMPVYPGETEKKIGYTQSFIGSGGFYQIYSGLSFKAFNHIALGANVYYMFGNINNYRTLVESNSSSSSTVYNNKIHASDFRLRYGLQFFNTFNKRHTVTLGLIYENKTKLNGSFSEIWNDSLLNSIEGFDLPQLFGAGLSYNLDDKLTVGIDYKIQSWGNTLFFNHTDSLVNSSSFSLGAEYIPNPRGRRTVERIRYRIGLNTSNPYYKIGTKTLPNNFGLSLGIGLPMRDNFTNKVSYINAALEYGKIGSNSMLREDYLKLTLSASFSELWFFKRKL